MLLTTNFQASAIYVAEITKRRFFYSTLKSLPRVPIIVKRAVVIIPCCKKQNSITHDCHPIAPTSILKDTLSVSQRVLASLTQSVKQLMARGICVFVCVVYNGHTDYLNMRLPRHTIGRVVLLLPTTGSYCLGWWNNAYITVLHTQQPSRWSIRIPQHAIFGGL